MRANFRVLAIVLLAFVAGKVPAETYKNADYGFEVFIPGGVKVCTNPPPEPNHGFVVLMGSDSCDAVTDRPRVDFFVSYNIPMEAKSTHDLTGDACGLAASKKANVVSAGVDVYECQLVRADNLFRRRYFFLRKNPRTRQPSNWVIFYVDMYSTDQSSVPSERYVHHLLRNVRWVGIK
jgi:hypothetical protein